MDGILVNVRGQIRLLYIADAPDTHAERCCPRRDSFFPFWAHRRVCVTRLCFSYAPIAWGRPWP